MHTRHCPAPQPRTVQVIENMARRCVAAAQAQAEGRLRRAPTATSADGQDDGSDNSDREGDDRDGREWLAKSREKTAEVLRKRKQLKRLMHMAAEKFNTDKKHWVEYVQVGTWWS